MEMFTSVAGISEDALDMESLLSRLLSLGVMETILKAIGSTTKEKVRAVIFMLRRTNFSLESM